MSILWITILNVCITAYFVKKKWNAAAICYIAAFLVLICYYFFSIDIPYVTDGLKVILGEELYETVYYNVTLYSDYAYNPYFAIQIMSLVAAIAISLTTAEKIVQYCRNKASARYAKTMRFRVVRVRLLRKFSFEKKYLSFCSILC